MIRDFNKSAQKANDYEESLNEIHEIVKRNNVHIVGVVQCRRPQNTVRVTDIENLDAFRPRIESIKNSSAFEERSRVILSTYRAKHYAQRLFPEDPLLDTMDDVLEVDILKQNMGESDRLKYLFNGSCAHICKFVEVE